MSSAEAHEPAGGAPLRPDLAALANRVLARDRKTLAQAITLVESRRPQDATDAQELLGRLLPHTGGAHRIGITGVPGVGKSTFIEALGVQLIERGHRIAVLAVDPSSSVSGGSILGDKSRMHRLSQSDAAFIRPSPAGGSLGGVGRRTRETLLLCEAAGFDLVLVETVGVGQSETMVAEMVDLFLVLMLPGAGDELQGIKRGVLELADLVAVNKADGDQVAAARRAQSEYSAVLRYTRGEVDGWKARALCVSALTGEGLAELWALAREHRQILTANGRWETRRREQRRSWLHTLLSEAVLEEFRNRPTVRARLDAVEIAVMNGEVTAVQGVRTLLASSGLPAEQD